MNLLLLFGARGGRARPPVARSIEHECADTFPRGTTSS